MYITDEFNESEVQNLGFMFVHAFFILFYFIQRAVNMHGIYKIVCPDAVFDCLLQLSSVICKYYSQ